MLLDFFYKDTFERKRDRSCKNSDEIKGTVWNESISDGDIVHLVVGQHHCPVGCYRLLT